MKKVLLVFLFLSFGISYSQTLPHVKNDTLITSTSYKIYAGLDLKIGTGSMNDGDFKFIRRNAASLFNYYSTTGYQGLANQSNSFSRSNSGLTFKVKKIMPRGSEKNGYVYYVKIGSGLINYEVDIENAIKSGEIILPDEFMPQSQSQNLSNESKYDKLKKIKELKDSGVLSEEEFQKEKEKIMNLK
ncbi:SHOCT domain-containing protein [Elizabethkingia bruuniana]|uniref:SHOCT domain-containing protein n=1 Tax=Elizabethkingia bruuniana TaxID=1756149 RepID=UPI00241DBC19|nr:SHOCT domain-containing protein [Elizabethkingia bruuniana]